MLACVLIISSVQAQKLAYKDLSDILKSPISDADDLFILKGYYFDSRNESFDKTSILYIYFNDESDRAEKRTVLLTTLPGKVETQYNLHYITKDFSEFQDFRKYFIEKKFHKESQDKISSEAEYSDNDNYIKLSEFGEYYEITICPISTNPKRIT